MLLVLAALALGAAAVSGAARKGKDRQRQQQRTREAKREIVGISQRTQDAILSELMCRNQSGQHRVVDGEVIAVRDERDEGGSPR